MKRGIETIKEKKWLHYLIIVAIGLLVAIPFCWVQLRDTDDGYIHLLRTISMGFSFEHGSFPYLLTPFFCRNFGYTMTAFYGPIVSYLPYIMSIITNSAQIAIKIFASLTIPISGITMYAFIYEVTKNKGISFLSAVIYMVFPYRLEIYYNRFAMGEIAAFMFIPVVFQGLHNLLHGNQEKHFYLTIGAVGLVLSHTITTTYVALFCFIYILFHGKDFLKTEVIIKCMINVIFIILISAFFLITIWEFSGQAEYIIFDANRMRTSGSWVAKNTIEPWQLIKDKGEEDGVSFLVGIPTLVMLAISILAYRYIDKRHKDFYIVYLILGIIALYMCTKFFPWSFMPQVLTNIQFAWRLEAFGMFFLTPVMAMNVCCLLNHIKQIKLRDTIFALVIFLIGFSTILELKVYPSNHIGLDTQYEEKIRKNPNISHFNVNRDYLPLKTVDYQSNYMLTREDKVYVIQGNAIIENENKNAFDLSFTIKQANQNSVLELPYLFYPGYIVKLTTENECEKLKIEESEKGFLQITLPKDIKEGNITISYTGTLTEKWGYAISVVALIFFLEYIICFKKNFGVVNTKLRKGRLKEEKNEGENKKL